MGRDLYVGGLGYFKFLKIWSMLKDMIEKITFSCIPYWVIPSTKVSWGDRTKDERKKKEKDERFFKRLRSVSPRDTPLLRLEVSELKIKVFSSLLTICMALGVLISVEWYILIFTSMPWWSFRM